MNRLAALLVAVTLAACAPAVSVAPAASPQPAPSAEPTFKPFVQREVAPDVPYLDPQNQKHHLSEAMGHFAFLIFFATYCPFCQEEVPKLQAFLAKHQADDMRVIAIEATGATAQAVEAFGVKFGVTMTLNHDTEKVAAMAFQIDNYPHIYTISPDGVVQENHLGNASSDYYENMFRIYGKVGLAK
ncbi:MAG: alkyl hydroperoxide reductase/Thiol specific antioxidant/Mal allergen [Cyanobacteria bacterium RYN_339]|nr:alkyl hydroperoxide reductase/Thiol specific antioxidant/Mal allergen [Cyanobacteria bacterium RYN_339]